ncbi:MAG TPA: hypothetical protein VN626_03070 [Clostridia bacterium]|nr:hypothetical protein [Clostridia bacterium]
MMCFTWVDLMADRNGFPGFLPSLRLEQVEPLVYELNTSTRQYRLDLTAAEHFAETFQRTEAWVLPEDWRIFTRTSLYIRDRIEAHKKQRQEQEFYKNAGLV